MVTLVSAPQKTSSAPILSRLDRGFFCLGKMRRQMDFSRASLAPTDAVSYPSSCYDANL
ncbi:hypothetical protein EMIT0196P_10137 [Pseudomonas chlororaphis]